MSFRTALLALAAAVGLTTASQATTITFDFAASNSGGWQNSLSYSQGGLDLTVIGKDTNGGAGQVATWAGHGLGMRSQSDCVLWGICVGTDHQIDSFGLNDVVIFTFNKAVNIAGLMFNYWDSTDTFDLYQGNGGGGLGHLLSAAVLPSVLLNSPLNTVFAIGAGTNSTQICKYDRRGGWNHCWTKTVNSAFKLKSMTVDVPAPIPVPAAGLLLIAGLGGLAAVKRFRRAA
jgi:hypothetical protein